MSQEALLSLLILIGGLVVSGVYFFVFGYLMPRNLRRAFARHFPTNGQDDHSMSADQQEQIRTPSNDPPQDEGVKGAETVSDVAPTEPAEFVDLHFIGCERGPNPPRQPLDEEWEASFSLIFSSAPDGIWVKLFDGLRLRYYRQESLPISLSARVEGEKFIFYCHPQQLQKVVDRLSEIIADTNQLYRRRLALAEIWPDEEAEFEEMIETSLTNLRLPSESLTPKDIQAED